ncbi:MAG: DUF4625 domain-containing protein [Prolixibacteraceae bacterium]
MKKVLLAFGITAVFLAACTRDKIDDEKPEIDITVSGAFPQNCDTLWLGESFTFKVLFSDNVELGSYSIEIHENFDHHSHSTEVTECILEPIKDPVNAFTFIQDYEIHEGLKEYETNQIIEIPAGNENGLFDQGNYHFFIRLTDKEGWSAQKGLSIKMMHR